MRRCPGVLLGIVVVWLGACTTFSGAETTPGDPGSPGASGGQSGAGGAGTAGDAGVAGQGGAIAGSGGAPGGGAGQSGAGQAGTAGQSGGSGHVGAGQGGSAGGGASGGSGAGGGGVSGAGGTAGAGQGGAGQAGAAGQGGGGSGAGQGGAGQDLCGNGLDDDEDGQVDEGCPCEAGAKQPCFSGLPSLAGKGACTLGEQACQPGGTWGACQGSGAPSVETCDGLDNDCNGFTDEGCSCQDGQQQGCSTGCGEGIQVCQKGGWGECSAPLCCNGQQLCPDGSCAFCCGDGDCPGGFLCQGGSCACPTGQKLCQGQCIPDGKCCTNGDCLGGKVCSGTKVCTCPGGKKDCGGFCGSCCQDSECSGTATCQAGECACPPEQCFDGQDNDCDGKTDCDDPDCNGAFAGYFYAGYNPDAWWLDGNPVNGVCVMVGIYCSQTGPQGIAPPPGYTQDSSSSDDCGYNGCNTNGPHVCQANFCKGCPGNCSATCP
jgi:hypothetical protein